MARRKDAPVSPELWAGIMWALLALCAAGLVALAAFSVLLRYLSSAPPED